MRKEVLSGPSRTQEHSCLIVLPRSNAAWSAVAIDGFSRLESAKIAPWSWACENHFTPAQPTADSLLKAEETKLTWCSSSPGATPVMRVALESSAIHSGEVYLLHFVTTCSSQVVGQESGALEKQESGVYIFMSYLILHCSFRTAIDLPLMSWETSVKLMQKLKPWPGKSTP